MWWCLRQAKDGAGTGMLGVVVLLEIYKWCRDRNVRSGGVSRKLQIVHRQECKMW